MLSPTAVERSKGERALFFAKYHYSGVVREVEGGSVILDGAWRHYACDEDVRLRRIDLKPTYLGDDVVLNLDYVESMTRRVAITWADEEDKLTKAVESLLKKRKKS